MEDQSYFFPFYLVSIKYRNYADYLDLRDLFPKKIIACV